MVQALIGQRVHELAKIGDQMVFPGNITVQKIGDAGHGEDNARYQREGRVKIHRAKLGQCGKHHKHRYQNNTHHCKFIGQIHTLVLQLFFHVAVQVVKCQSQ